jgi:molybdopterin biosynthesis enzyme MoaB
VKESKGKTDIIFYDVTNFYYEIEDLDEDEVDESGEVLRKELRKMGVSKEVIRKTIKDDNGKQETRGIAYLQSYVNIKTLI